MSGKLDLPEERIARCRELAREVADSVHRETDPLTTVSTERTVLRLLGVDGVDADDVPIPNRAVEALAAAGKLGRGAAVWVGSALAEGEPEPGAAARRLARPGEAAAISEHPRWREAFAPYARAAVSRIAANRADRERRLAAHPADELPLLYVIVATGNIHQDVVQAQAAARAGAQAIAVIRSTAQSLLDYVPYGATTSGFGGTFATQENFRLMRRALDALEPELDRTVRLVNYCSGLCMPEIAAMGALERLDLMLNDALYGIIFRDVNPLRTLVDQAFSRRINAAAGVVINTGEDNYLTTADAVEQAPAVLASQLVNERLAKDAGLEDWQIGLGHAFEIDPELEDGLLHELAQAEMAREIFPDAPLKYMPPTKHMTGNVFRGYQQNALFVLASVATGQSIHLVGMLTEALHTPFLHDRWLAIDQARTIRANARHLAEELEWKRDGRVVRRAHEVLAEAERLLGDVAREGLFDALAAGRFADTKRPRDGGRGRDGVIAKQPGYENPFEEIVALVSALRTAPDRDVRGGAAIETAREPTTASAVDVPSPSAPIRAYGDKPGDGAVQLSFTLPIGGGAAAVDAARRYVAKMGLREPYVTLAQEIAPGFTFFIVYGRSPHELDRSELSAQTLEVPELSREEIDAGIAKRFGRRLVVLGCALESDAHTVGLDAIFNMKGFAGDYGLERYHGLDARNLGAQVPVERAVRLVKESGADALLVSATVTQNDIHVHHLTDLVDMLEAERLRDRVVLIAGGARVDHALAKELGFDAGFGPGTKPSLVAAFLLEEVSRRSVVPA